MRKYSMNVFANLLRSQCVSSGRVLASDEDSGYFSHYWVGDCDDSVGGG
jgi:hypothetical protein